MFEDQRDALNALFRSRIKQGAKIDSQAFAEHIRTRIVPCVEAISLVLPERTRLSTLELFEVSLDLFMVGHFENESKTPHLYRLWSEHLPKLAKHLACDPRRVAGSLSNALIKIEMQSSHTAERWLSHVETAAQYTESVDELLNLGKAAAWLSGMPHYRTSAIAAMRLLPKSLILRLLEMPLDLNEPDIHTSLEKMVVDPWYSILGSNSSDAMQVRQVGHCGAFVGFGGEMRKPPVVTANEGMLVASDGQHVWQIFADRFGAVTQRIDLSPFHENKIQKKTDPRLTTGGLIRWGESQLKRPDLANASSSAFDGGTFAVTIPTSFQVVLFAQTAPLAHSVIPAVKTVATPGVGA